MEDYRITNRGGKGVKTLSITEKTGELVAILGVTDEDDLMVINKSGITIRTGADELRTMGRATQGVRLINLRKNDSIAAVCRTPKSDEEEALTAIEGRGRFTRGWRLLKRWRPLPKNKTVVETDGDKVWHGMC